MQTDSDIRDALDIWRQAIVSAVRRDAPDLSARQMAILLTVYLTPPPHTVRGLAKELNISKPAVSRALDAMGRHKLLKRKRDEKDRRSVLVQPTMAGMAYLGEYAEDVRTALSRKLQGMSA